MKVDIQNEYLKEKLTEFYKENKRLNQKIQELIAENKKFKTCNRQDRSTSPISLEKKSVANKSDNQTVLQQKLLLSSGSKCSVCSRSNTKTSSSFSKNKNIQTDLSVKNSIGVNTVDKDFFNRQNKVIK